MSFQKRELFRTALSRYDQNVSDAKRTYARPALLDTPAGPTPAVAVFSGRRLSGVYPVRDAMRLANEIADSITHHKEKEIA